MNYHTEIEGLLDFDLKKRIVSLHKIARLVKKGELNRGMPEKSLLNMHLHTFHSFNYLNWSPSRILLEGFLKGLKYMGIVDFDTTAATEETWLASEIFAIPTLSGFETRVFVKEFQDRVINSPGEPGIYYYCAMGFKKIRLKIRRQQHFSTGSKK